MSCGIDWLRDKRDREVCFGLLLWLNLRWDVYGLNWKREGKDRDFGDYFNEFGSEKYREVDNLKIFFV